MPKLEQFCTGTIAGTIGYLTANVDLPIPARVGIGLATSGFFAYSIYRKGHEETSHAALLSGAALANGLGYLLEYGITSPQALNLSFLSACCLLVNVFTNKMNLLEELQQENELLEKFINQESHPVQSLDNYQLSQFEDNMYKL